MLCHVYAFICCLSLYYVNVRTIDWLGRWYVSVTKNSAEKKAHVLCYCMLLLLFNSTFNI